MTDRPNIPYECTLSKELQSKAERELNETPERRKEAIKELREKILECKGREIAVLVERSRYLSFELITLKRNVYVNLSLFLSYYDFEVKVTRPGLEIRPSCTAVLTLGHPPQPHTVKNTKVDLKFS